MIVGTEGSIRIHEPFYAPNRITWTRTHEPIGPVSSSASRRSGGWKSRIKRNPLFRRAVDQIGRPLLGAIRRDATTITGHIAGQGYQFEAAEAMRCLRAGEPESPLMPLDESVAILESVDALRRSWSR
jgi:hypothetical protein